MEHHHASKKQIRWHLQNHQSDLRQTCWYIYIMLICRVASIKRPQELQVRKFPQLQEQGICLHPLTTLLGFFWIHLECTSGRVLWAERWDLCPDGDRNGSTRGWHVFQWDIIYCAPIQSWNIPKTCVCVAKHQSSFLSVNNSSLMWSRVAFHGFSFTKSLHKQLKRNPMKGHLLATKIAWRNWKDPRLRATCSDRLPPCQPLFFGSSSSFGWKVFREWFEGFSPFSGTMRGSYFPPTIWATEHVKTLSTGPVNPANQRPINKDCYVICSMYGIFTYICFNNHPNVGKYTIHGTYGYVMSYNLWKIHFNPRLSTLKRQVLSHWGRCTAAPVRISATEQCWVDGKHVRKKFLETSDVPAARGLNRHRW